MLGEEILASMLREYQFKMNDIIYSTTLFPWHAREVERMIDI